MKDSPYYLLLRAVVHFAVRNFGYWHIGQAGCCIHRVFRGYVWGKVVSFQIKVNFFENGTVSLLCYNGKNITGLIWEPFLPFS